MEWGKSLTLFGYGNVAVYRQAGKQQHMESLLFTGKPVNGNIRGPIEGYGL